jgi:hypothetical protein
MCTPRRYDRVHRASLWSARDLSPLWSAATCRCDRASEVLLIARGLFHTAWRRATGQSGDRSPHSKGVESSQTILFRRWRFRRCDHQFSNAGYDN